MGVRTLSLLAGMLLFIAGCLTTKDVPAIVPEAQTVEVAYVISEGLEVNVTFESKRAFNATQLGLAFFNKYKENKKLLRVEDAEFFPEYFAMVNVDFDDELLYISDEEAHLFSKRIFRAYQKQVTPPEMLHAVKKTRMFEDITITDTREDKPVEKEVE